MKKSTLKEVITKPIRKHSVDNQIENGFCYECDALVSTFLPGLIDEIAEAVMEELDWILWED